MKKGVAQGGYSGRIHNPGEGFIVQGRTDSNLRVQILEGYQGQRTDIIVRVGRMAGSGEGYWKD